MKLSKAESKALKFVVFLLALSAFARWRGRPIDPVIDTSAVLPTVQETPRESVPVGPLDPNTASLHELDRLPGIGKATAQRIIDSRPYGDLSDLALIVGNKRASKLAPLVTLPARRTGKPLGSDGDISTRQVEINRASKEELQRLPGIGPALADRIIAKRDSVGRFDSWLQLDSVKGVGPALLAKIKARGTL